jgi:hypothetical protein
VNAPISTTRKLDGARMVGHLYLTQSTVQAGQQIGARQHQAVRQHFTMRESPGAIADLGMIQPYTARAHAGTQTKDIQSAQAIPQQQEGMSPCLLALAFMDQRPHANAFEANGCSQAGHACAQDERTRV